MYEIALAIFGLLPPLWVLLVMALLNGAALQVGQLVWTNMLQELAPNEKLGRVVSIDNIGSFALLPIEFALAGWATETFGAPFVFILGGIITALLSVLGLLHPAIRNLD
jgi:sugar phosphate permease